MEVIGKDGQGNYIAIVSHDELEKSANQYYGKLPRLNVGDEFNIGAGYNFKSDIESACKNMLDACRSFETSRTTMMNFAVMVQEASSKEQP